MPNKSNNILATVVVLTYNGQEFIEEVLTAVVNQKTNFSYVIHVYDSESGDDTVKIVQRFEKKYPQKIQLTQTKKADFGHGKSRNLAVQNAESEFVCMLTQDATPSSDSWLQGYIDAFSLDPKIALAFGPHLPRKDSNPVIKRDLERHFANFPTDESGVLIQGYGSGNKPEDLDTTLSFFSDVNSCIRKAFWEKHKYENVSYAEDQIIAREMLKAGLKKAFVLKSSVYHSHTYPTMQYLGRYFDEYCGLKESVGFIDRSATFLKIWPQALRLFWGDSRYIFSVKEYTFWEKLKWSLVAFWMGIFRRLGAFFARRDEKLPKFFINFLSREAMLSKRKYRKH